ncbi:MAG TPA: hypothetical protein VNV16_11895 [Methylibium sp.]|nr:hypothetical protein [Methylibium sp.]
MIRLLAFMLLAVVLSFAQPAQACAPAPWGQGTKPQVGLNEVGAWAAWYCNDGYVVTRRLHAVRWDGLTPELRADLNRLTDAPNMAVFIAEMAARHRTLSIGDPQLLAVWGRDDERISNAAPADIPVWRVTPNTRATDLSRPMYLLLPDGVRGAPDYARVQAEALCDCSRRAVEGSSVYCAVPPILTSVALCRRQP